MKRDIHNKAHISHNHIVKNEKFLVTDLVLCNGQVHGRASDEMEMINCGGIKSAATPIKVPIKFVISLKIWFTYKRRWCVFLAKIYSYLFGCGFHAYSTEIKFQPPNFVYQKQIIY